jgi:hypothetical protein
MREEKYVDRTERRRKRDDSAPIGDAVEQSGSVPEVGDKASSTEYVDGHRNKPQARRHKQHTEYDEIPLLLRKRDPPCWATRPEQLLGRN